MTLVLSDSEKAIENATLALFAKLGWETVNGYHEVTDETRGAGSGPYLGRATRNEVILRPRLEAALARLNPGLPPEALIRRPSFRQVKNLQSRNVNLRRTCTLLLPRLISGELDVSELEISGAELNGETGSVT
jgi:type I site-specific restriction-modification system R (restriction) subunit